MKVGARYLVMRRASRIMAEGTKRAAWMTMTTTEAAEDHACQSLTEAMADLWTVAQRVPSGPRLLALWASTRTLEQAMAQLTNAVAARVDGERHV